MALAIQCIFQTKSYKTIDFTFLVVFPVSDIMPELKLRAGHLTLLVDLWELGSRDILVQVAYYA